MARRGTERRRMQAQLLVRLDSELAAALDDAVAAVPGFTRTKFVREVIRDRLLYPDLDGNSLSTGHPNQKAIRVTIASAGIRVARLVGSLVDCAKSARESRLDLHCEIENVLTEARSTLASLRDVLTEAVVK